MGCAVPSGEQVNMQNQKSDMSVDIAVLRHRLYLQLPACIGVSQKDNISAGPNSFSIHGQTDQYVL